MRAAGGFQWHATRERQTTHSLESVYRLFWLLLSLHPAIARTLSSCLFLFCFLFFVLFSAGGTNLKDLMQVPLTPARLSNAAVVVVVDLSQVRPPAKSPRWLAFAFCILLAYPP